MVDILKNIMNIAYRVRDMQIAGTLSMALFGVVLVFGIMNCGIAHPKYTVMHIKNLFVLF